MDQCVHVVTTTQELHHRTRNFAILTRDYLVDEGPLSWAMSTWPHHIDRFEWQLKKACALNPFFGAYLVDRIHKLVQVFLHSCNKTCLDDVETGVLLEFGKLKWHIEWGKWITSTPVWLELPMEIENGGGNWITAEAADWSRKSGRWGRRRTGRQTPSSGSWRSLGSSSNLLVMKDTCDP